MCQSFSTAVNIVHEIFTIAFSTGISIKKTIMIGIPVSFVNQGKNIYPDVNQQVLIFIEIKPTDAVHQQADNSPNGQR